MRPFTSTGPGAWSATPPVRSDMIAAVGEERFLQRFDVLDEYHPPLVRLVDASLHEHGPRRVERDAAGLERLGEDGESHHAVHRVQRGEGHAIAALGGPLAEL